jgi:hypothetical protein
MFSAAHPAREQAAWKEGWNDMGQASLGLWLL